jgi:molybdopterin synthase sulfur carrier subunit
VARVLFFGRLRDITGAAEIEIDADTLSALRGELMRTNPALGEALAAPGVSVAIDKVICRADSPLTRASEVAFMPPLSGG